MSLLGQGVQQGEHKLLASSILCQQGTDLILGCEAHLAEQPQGLPRFDRRPVCYSEVSPKTWCTPQGVTFRDVQLHGKRSTLQLRQGRGECRPPVVDGKTKGSECDSMRPLPGEQ